ncbi:MAG TPA: S46 family peptidase, partial [Phycisphaerae bacterium]|nr:S46 family peptidase [Phycisphaerae bacterium]
GMWLLTRPPTRELKQRYDFEPAPGWLEHLQKSCVRIGASGSLVSPNGLVMTNHHVGHRQIEKLSTPERNLLQTGFLAKTRGEELKCPDMDVEILWSIEDVTERINAAVTPEMSSAAAFGARRKAMTKIEEEAKEKSGLEYQVVTLYHGALYHLYGYKRYTDVRLVMAPEKSVAYFGGDHDNFEYPRFDLDMCFFRIYENDQPLKCEHYLKWSSGGGADGDLTFVLGHPRRTQRLYTVDHLKFLRDVDSPAQLNGVCQREVLLTVFAERNEENARIAAGASFGNQNRRKSLLGIYSALLDPQLWAAKRAEEEKLRAAVAADPQKKARWGDAWEQIAAAEQTYRELYKRHSALHGRALGSDLFRIAMTLVRLADELPKPNTERLREYRDSELESVYMDLYSPAPIYDVFEIERLSSGLMLLAEQLSGDDPLIVKALDGLTPRARAEKLVSGCTLKDVAARKHLAEGGKEAIAASRDPMIALARVIDPEARAVQQRYENEVESVERENYAKIGAARFAVFGEDVYPDATGTLRLSFGPVKGYQEDGNKVLPFTTFAGLYQRSQERHGQPPFDLPTRWLDRKDKLKLDTPLDFVCTADIIGGNSGSPAVNKAGEVIGLVFDGNLQGLAWDIAYSDAQGRAVAVDSRAIIEALRKVYDADGLADEITGR